MADADRTDVLQVSCGSSHTVALLGALHSNSNVGSKATSAGDAVVAGCTTKRENAYSSHSSFIAFSPDSLAVIQIAT
jgi:hypothetical protein